MTDRQEMEAARVAGLPKRHAKRLLNATTPRCNNCDASYAGCETRRWLSGRHCCPRCTHDTTAEEA